ncbi:MAG: hypothetical protein PQJ46_10390 [Spirochaetales bacterium]|nr:hypothetical protein [Spirochaetales bacterium]
MAIKIQQKIKRFFTKSDISENYNDNNSSNFLSASPAKRTVPASDELIPKRILTANMNGQITLSGIDMDLHFTKGYIRGLTQCDTQRVNCFKSESYITTSLRKIKFRNESAFAFDSENEYGLRTLQVPKGNEKNRIITDFCFNREKEEFTCSIFIQYPTFKRREKILASAPIELQLDISSYPVEIITNDSDNPVSFHTNNQKYAKLKGSSFDINYKETTVSLSFLQTYNGKKVSEIKTLEAKTAIKGKHNILKINPGGTYTSSSAENFNGIKEFFCFNVKLKKIENI